MPFQLGYVSTAAQTMDRGVLTAILEVARARNAEHAVTGLLLYHNGRFLQLLEGDEAAVRETFERIYHDSRHRDVTLLFEDQADDRLFSNWSMGFQLLADDVTFEFPDPGGTRKDLRSMTEDIGRAKQLLLLFRRRGLDPERDIVTNG